MCSQLPRHHRSLGDNMASSLFLLMLACALPASALAGDEVVATQKSRFDGQESARSSASTITRSRLTIAGPSDDWLILHRPYLKIVGPTGLRLAAPSEPIVRNPPRVPAVRKAPPKEGLLSDAAPVEAVKITTLPEPPAVRVQSSANVLGSDDASTTLPPLPVATPTPTPAGPSTAPPDTLSHQNESSEDLSDALLYLNVPAPNGVGAAVVAPIHLDPPSVAPQPPSSATYEVK